MFEWLKEASKFETGLAKTQKHQYAKMLFG